MKALEHWGVPLAAAASMILMSGCLPNADFTVGGTVSGLNGTVGLSLNNGGQPRVISANGPYEFNSIFPPGSAYAVTIATQPIGQLCSVTNATGVIQAADITNVDVSCVDTAAPVISTVWPARLVAGYEAVISGSNLEGASVALNGETITPTQQTAQQIRFIAPANPPGSYLLELQNDSGTATRDVTQGTIMASVSFGAGISHACAALTSGEVRCWGENAVGELGNGGASQSEAPVLASGITTAVAVDADISHSCAVLASGAMQCWGSPSHGQLGTGDGLVHRTPTDVRGISTAVDVTTGLTHTCALLSDGSVQCWGNNGSGRLGDGTTARRLIPATVKNITTAVAVSAGQDHSCALMASGVVQCWGENSNGQLGNGTTTDSSLPVTVSGISNAVAISAGQYYNCAVLGSGEVQCWGNNADGQLGDGTTTGSTIPVTVSGIGNAVAIAAASDHTCAVIGGGAVQCWGDNRYGKLGDESTTDSLTPVTVTEIGPAVAVSVDVNQSYSCATLDNATVHCWGAGHAAMGLTPGIPLNY